MSEASEKTAIVLGIESSCDETAAAVVRLGPDGGAAILSDVVLSQVAEHAAFGGVVPELAARAHLRWLPDVLRRAMREAAGDWTELDAVAVTAGPGLIGGLITGMMTAKAIALASRCAFIAVNHLEAHALSPMLTEGIAPPYLLLLVSGGHTQLISVDDIGRYRRYGTTIDDALGEAFDKVAKMLGLGYPGGPAVEKLAANGDAARFAFPRPMKGRAECHFSFSGLKTAVRTAALALDDPTQRDKADICASFQQAVAESLADRVSRAIDMFLDDHPDLAERRLVVAGGVAANRALRGHLQQVAAQHGFTLHAPPPAMCTDNAAMVAHAGALKLARGQTDPLNTPARARWPLDPAAEPAIFAGVKG